CDAPDSPMTSAAILPAASALLLVTDRPTDVCTNAEWCVGSLYDASANLGGKRQRRSLSNRRLDPAVSFSSGWPDPGLAPIRWLGRAGRALACVSRRHRRCLIISAPFGRLLARARAATAWPLPMGCSRWKEHKGMAASPDPAGPATPAGPLAGVRVLE